MKNLFHETVSAVCFTGLAVSIGTGIASAHKVDTLEGQLKAVPNYVASLKVDNATYNVDSAQYNLTYRAAYTTFVKSGKSTIPIHHPPRYPDTNSAKQNLSAANAQLAPLLHRQDTLEEVAQELPSSDRLTEYKGKRVNNQTFAEERDLLEHTKKRLVVIKGEYLNLVPRHLLEGKSTAIRNTIFSLVAGGICTALGIYMLAVNED